MRGCDAARTRGSRTDAGSARPQDLLVAPGPLYRIATWLAPVEPAVLGLTPAQVFEINDDRVARALDALTLRTGAQPLVPGVTDHQTV